MLYDMTDGALTMVSTTTFKAEQVLERTHLQAAIRDQISLLGEDLMVVAEEYGDFADTNRRIDLLCVDRSARLVVVELKRTEDGGHMELQALRYAAMVSVMTFKQLVQTFAKHLKALGKDSAPASSARDHLLTWLDEFDGDEPVISRDVGIVLASANFSQEVTTAVLWLNEFHGFDIRCIRLQPYQHQGRLLLDVQQVIPLPEAAELTVKLRERDAEVKKAKSVAGGFSKYVVVTPSSTSDPMPKRWAMLHYVHALHGAGVSGKELAIRLPHVKFRELAGTLRGDEVKAALMQEYSLAELSAQRFHLDEPFARRRQHLGDQYPLERAAGTCRDRSAC